DERAYDYAHKNADDGNIAVCAFHVRGLAMPEGMQRDAERSGDHPQRLEDADQSGSSNSAYTDVAHIEAIDLRGGHVRYRNSSRVNRDVAHVATDKPDRRNQDEVNQYAAGAEDHGDPQTHDVAQPQDETDGVEVEHHAISVGQVLHHPDELEVQILLPDVKAGNEEVVHSRDTGGLEQELRLRSALLTGDQDFGDRRSLREGKLAVLFAHEVAAQGNQEENTLAAAGE